jgi:hypothetical protein
MVPESVRFVMVLFSIEVRAEDSSPVLMVSVLETCAIEISEKHILIAKMIVFFIGLLIYLFLNRNLAAESA